MKARHRLVTPLDSAKTFYLGFTVNLFASFFEQFFVIFYLKVYCERVRSFL